MDHLFDLPPGIDEPAVLPRCWPSTDAVVTDGERRRSGAAPICLDWANGRCMQGTQCEQRHGLPSLADENRLNFSADGLTRDIFGRPRAESDSAALPSGFDPLACSTIHVLSGVPGGDQQARRRMVDEAFGEWGQVVRTWFTADVGSCFVKFKWRSTAQLVLEACRGRPLRPEVALPLTPSPCHPVTLSPSQPLAPSPSRPL